MYHSYLKFAFRCGALLMGSALEVGTPGLENSGFPLGIKGDGDWEKETFIFSLCTHIQGVSCKSRYWGTMRTERRCSLTSNLTFPKNISEKVRLQTGDVTPNYKENL